MKHLIYLTLCFLVGTIGALAQDAPSRPASTDREVVKISVNLIQLDVSVNDRNGKVITDLRPDEIELFENGVKQKVTAFSFISNPQPKPSKGKNEAVGLPEPAVNLRPEQVRRTIALVVDDLTLSFQSAAQTRRALKKFVDEQMMDGDLVAIIRTGAGIGALQQFTSNKYQLYAAIDRVKWNPKGAGKMGSFDPVEPTANESLLRMPGKLNTGDPPTTEQLDEIKEDLESERIAVSSWNDFRESLFTAGTLGALKYIVNGMAELPGRKSVIMFSDGMRIFENTEGGSFNASRTMAFLQGLAAEANRKSVIFYPVDARGLIYTGFTAADQIPNTLGDSAEIASQRSFGQRLSDRSNEIFNSQQGLKFLADETGGFAYTDGNDLSLGVQKALEDQSYYLVAYQPGGEEFDPDKRRFNKIEVRVKRDNVKVRHRSGFFLGEEEKKVVVDLNYPTKIMRALTSPFALNGITVKLNALFGHSAKTGYFVHSFLHIDAADLEFKKLPNGDYKASFEILAISYGDNGAPVDKNNSTGSTIVKAEHLERIRRDGFAYSFIFPMKKPGAYQMRVALMDRESKEVGSANQFIEVPDLKKNGITLSGIVLENVSREYWARLAGGSAQVNAGGNLLVPFDAQDPKYSTAARTFRRGTVLRYGIEILNARSSEKDGSRLTVQSRVFHDRKMVFQSREHQITSAALAGVKEYVHTDAVELGPRLLPGDYVLQVLVTDTTKKKPRVVTQYVQFEVVG